MMTLQPIKTLQIARAESVWPEKDIENGEKVLKRVWKCNILKLFTTFVSIVPALQKIYKTENRPSLNVRSEIQ